MKRFLLLSSFFFPQFITAQIQADSIYQNQLYYVCKVWGHLKYHHSEIAKGSVNWDRELLKVIPKIKSCKNNADFNKEMYDFCLAAGTMQRGSGPRPVIPTSLNVNSDVNWMNDSIFSPQMRFSLNDVFDQFRRQSNVYVGEGWRTVNGKIQFPFDQDNQFYSQFTNPHEEIRLLALFRLWNIVHYFYPYKHILDQDWDSTLIEFIPRLLAANSSESYSLALRECCNRLNDSHASCNSYAIQNWNGGFLPPFTVRFIEGETVITRVTKNAKSIQVGDVLREIDGVDIKALRDSLRRYANGSNNTMVEKSINSLIVLGPSGQFDITVSDGLSIKTETLTRNSDNRQDLYFNSSPIKSWTDTVLENKCRIGIVNMGELKREEIPQMVGELWSTDGIIFDLRGYPNGTFPILMNYLLPYPVHGASYTVYDPTYPGAFTWNDSYAGNGTGAQYNGKIAILFDENTQSQAENTCMFLEQYPRSIKIGSTTAGADGNVARIYLPGGVLVSPTFMGWYYPDRTQTQRVGIIPDIRVEPTIKGIKENKDEIVDVAFRELTCEKDTTLNIGKNEIDRQLLTLYPNPTGNQFKYRISGLEKNEVANVDIYGTTGNKLLNLEINSRTGLIDISDLEVGLYFISIKTADKMYTATIVKE